jgi:riboflavin kinase / FMN adenylyltransferase
MLLIRQPKSTPAALLNGCVATIGVYDGLHVGHQLILSRVLAAADEHGLPALLFSFEPTPQEYFSAATAPARLMRFREKYQALQAVGMDAFYCPRFQLAFSSLEPQAFVEQLLKGMLNVKHLVVGDDFRFARKRSGTIDDLIVAGERYGFAVEQVASVSLDGERVSSTGIRSALQAGDLAKASRILGRPYQMSGRVVAGQRLGQTLGFPTANLKLNRKLSPLSGIFAVRVLGLGDVPLHAVASLGTRPTVNGVEPLLEVHIFDFSADIYGKHIDVEFIAKLRDEEKFPNLDTMRKQMHIDAAEARAILLAA